VNVSPLAAKRNLIGVVALVCVATAVGMWIFTDDPQQNAFLAAVTRVGIVMAALWLALPARGESVVWSKAGPILILGVVLVALFGSRLRYVWYLLPVAIFVALALAFLKPRAKRRKPR
jgi:hypothetical protein